MLDRFFCNDGSVVYARGRYVELASSVDAINESTSVVDGTDGAAAAAPSTSDMVDSDPVVSDLPSSSEVSTEISTEVVTEVVSEVSTEEVRTEISTEATTEEISTETSVSSNEIVISGGTVSVNNAADYTGILQDMSADLKSLREEPTLFDKPLNDYTVSEGLLLIIVVLLLAMFVSKIMRGGERHV